MVLTLKNRLKVKGTVIKKGKALQPLIEVLFIYIGAKCGKNYLYFIYTFSRNIDVLITSELKKYYSKTTFTFVKLRFQFSPCFLCSKAIFKPLKS